MTSGTIREEELDRQIDELLNGYTILPEFRDWALDVIRSQNEAEAEQRNSVYEMQHQSVVSTQKQLDKLIDMVSRDLISEEDFNVKSQELKAKINTMQEKLRDTEKRAETRVDIVEQTLDFAVNARKRFENGDFDTKRSVLLGMGQNHVVLDGKIKITPSEWFVPIQNSYPMLESSYLKVKTANNGKSKVLDAELVPIQSKWLGRRFWNQTSDDDLAPKKNQSPEQEVHEIRQLLDEDDPQSEEVQC